MESWSAVVPLDQTMMGLYYQALLPVSRTTRTVITAHCFPRSLAWPAERRAVYDVACSGSALAQVRPLSDIWQGVPLAALTFLTPCSQDLRILNVGRGSEQTLR